MAWPLFNNASAMIFAFRCRLFALSASIGIGYQEHPCRQACFISGGSTLNLPYPLHTSGMEQPASTCFRNSNELVSNKSEP